MSTDRATRTLVARIWYTKPACMSMVNFDREKV